MRVMQRLQVRPEHRLLFRGLACFGARISDRRTGQTHAPGTLTKLGQAKMRNALYGATATGAVFNRGPHAPHGPRPTVQRMSGWRMADGECKRFQSWHACRHMNFDPLRRAAIRHFQMRRKVYAINYQSKTHLVLKNFLFYSVETDRYRLDRWRGLYPVVRISGDFEYRFG